jgi:hypothetical protein
MSEPIIPELVREFTANVSNPNEITLTFKKPSDFPTTSFASEDLQYSNDSFVDFGSDKFDWKRILNIIIDKKIIGTQRFKFDIIGGRYDNIVRARIYKNRYPIGTEQTHHGTEFITIIEDIEMNWDIGDSLELWVKCE